MNCYVCGSYAINHDPEKELCDACWRDKTIAEQRVTVSEAINRVREATDERDRLRAENERLRAAHLEVKAERERLYRENERLRAFVEDQLCDCFDEYSNKRPQMCDRCKLLGRDG